MKRLPIIALLLAPWLLLAAGLSELPLSTNSFTPSMLLLFAAVLLFNMAYAFVLPHLGFSGRQLLFWSMLVKLCNIPIYLCVFLTVLFLHILILPLAPILFLFDYFLLLPSSMYGISGILCCARSGLLSRRTLCVNLAAQFLFCFDVISAVCCYIMVRRREQARA